MKNKKLKWIIGIIGMIILGAIGSGLWRLLLEPLSIWFGRALFTVATLGLNSLRNAVYSDIAKGLHEAPSLVLLAFLLALPLFSLIGFHSFLFGRRKAKREIHNAITEIENRNPDPNTRTKEIEKMLENGARSSRRTMIRVITLVLSVLIAFCFFQLFTIAYTNGAITHFRQCFTICQPFMVEIQEEETFSKFARIKSRDDYMTLLQELYQTAESNGAECPSFTVF